MANLRYSAAKTSTVSKRNIFKSPTKTRPLKNLLPGQSKYKQNLKQSPKKSHDKLSVEDYNVELDFQLSRKHDIITAINTILDNWWTESSSLNDKQEAVFQLKGLSMASKAEIIKYRSNQLSHGLVTTNQLYSIFDREGHTFVDRNIEMAIRNGQIKKFVITNASPIILSAHNGPTSYGYENVEIIAKSDTYFLLLASPLKETTITRKFNLFVTKNPSALFITTGDGFNDSDLSTLVDLGFVTLTSNHINEIDSLQYAIAFPNCGTFLKLINNGRSWVVKTLSKNKFKEMLDKDLWDRWEANLSNFRKPFYGFDLSWILADALGLGIIEVFNTPVGRGWKLTGKR